MKVLVAYHSKTGTCRKVGTAIAKALGADVDEIVPVNLKPLYKPDGKMDSTEMMVLVFQVMLKWNTKLKPSTKNPASYDLVVVGTPTWGGGLSAPVRSYLSAHGKDIKKAAFFCTMGTNEAEKASKQESKVFSQMESLVGKPVAILSVSQKDADSPQTIARIKTFCDSIRKA